MTKIDVLDIISREHLVEKIVYKLLPASKNRFDCPADLVQDIYILLLTKDDNLIGDLYQKKELGYYILRIAKNQLLSCNSPYFYTYIRFGSSSEDLDNVKDKIYE